jgi:4a-hydroxytetrahydrobiopterin dehydratase
MQDHHPDMEIKWRTVTLTFTTHAAKGLTLNDFVMAAKVEKLFELQSTV